MPLAHITLITHKYGVTHYSIFSIYIYILPHIYIIVRNIYRIQFLSQTSWYSNLNINISSNTYVNHHIWTYKVGFLLTYRSELEFLNSSLELVHDHPYLLHIILPLHMVHKHINHALKLLQMQICKEWLFCSLKAFWNFWPVLTSLA